MTDKVQKIREEVERLKRWNDNVRESTRHMTLQEEDFNRGKHSSYLEILNFIDSMQEEHVSEDLEKAAEQDVCEVVNCCSATGIPNDHIPSWVQDAMVNEFIHGAKWQKEKLWKPADGDNLPEYDREVVVLIKYNAQRNIHDEEYPTYRVGFGHRPNPNGWDGKNIDTNEVTHYTPKLYDKGGWNAPNIVYWLDAKLPYEENKIIK